MTAWPAWLDRAGRGRQAPEGDNLRTIQRCVLRTIGTVGAAPSADDIAVATGVGDVAGALRRLHAEDFLRLDASGRIVAAYPFSASPTAHQIAIRSGPNVHAMCAIDALGIAAMLGRPTAIRSIDPHSGAGIAVDVQPDRSLPPAHPHDAVVGIATTPRRPAGTPEAAADTCCAHINFFASTDTARAWLAERPGLRGDVVALGEAHDAGVAIFGHLLG